MTAMAARSMGYRILVLDPDPACPARFVVDGCIEAAWDDSREAANLARGCDVVTLEIEQIAPTKHGGCGELGTGAAERAMLRIIQIGWSRRTGCGEMAFRWGSFARCERARSCARRSLALGRAVLLQERARGI